MPCVPDWQSSRRSAGDRPRHLPVPNGGIGWICPVCDELNGWRSEDVEVRSLAHYRGILCQFLITCFVCFSLPFVVFVVVAKFRLKGSNSGLSARTAAWS